MNKNGFTLIEMLVVIGLIAVIGVVSGVSLFGKKSTATLTSTTQEISALLREAQSDAMAQSQGSLWGVHFDDSSAPFYSLFYTSNGSYNSSTQVSRYSLPSGICYATSSVAAGSSTNIIFGGVTGVPSASATIILQLMSNGGCSTATSSGATGSVTRAGSGEIFFDNFNRSNL